jgi:hypothetical protein
MLHVMPVVLACFLGSPAAPEGRTNQCASSPTRAIQHQTHRASAPSSPLRAAMITTDWNPQRPRLSRTRPQLGRPGGSGAASKGMLILAGIVAGMYVGGAVGTAADDHPDKGLGFVGMQVGGAIGGLVVWKLVR